LADNEELTQEQFDELKKELEAEKEAKATFEASITEKETKITELEGNLKAKDEELTQLKQAGEGHQGELDTLKTSLGDAVGKYRGLVLASNPAVPEELVAGESIADIEASLEKAKGLVSKVTAQVTQELTKTVIPAGSPARTGPATEGMSAREKINYGLEQSKK